MDIRELLSFQPDKPVFNDENVTSSSTKRKRRLESDVVKSEEKKPKLNQISAEQKIIDMKEKISKLLEEDDSKEVEPMDELALKKLLLQFEKKSSKNQEMRIKFPDNAEKFLDSEVELNEVIQEMHIIATVPDLYHVLIELHAIQSILYLLSHENTDISLAVVNLLQEMTDVDALNDSEEGANALIDALMKGQVLALLVQNLERLDESNKEEFDGVHNSLAILENMSELKPEICIEAVQQGFLTWLLKRIKVKSPFDENRLYCSELISILVQTFPENKQSLGEADGIDILLSQLSLYKRHDPSSPEEIEYMENLFMALCSCLMLSTNRGRFLKGEGLQLMNLMLREKKMSKTSALKVLDHAMIGREGVDNCNKFVDILGLRSIFSLFMKSPKSHKKVGPSKQQLEEHVVSIIASLVKNCEGNQRQRLLQKFTENDHEKVDRLIELHFKYLDQLQSVDNKIEEERRMILRGGVGISEDADEEFFMRRLDGGLYTLQFLDYIIIDISHSSTSSVRGRVVQIINLRGGSIKTIKSIMREYAGSIGDAESKETQHAMQDKILALIDKF